MKAAFLFCLWAMSSSFETCRRGGNLLSIPWGRSLRPLTGRLAWLLCKHPLLRLMKPETNARSFHGYSVG
ncbi:hypothetical protein KCP71_11820 [Salmonella enterica subsp. enterica]|nr:hypothetical protein KCP71_11820 [Salmonella enterica subsp. enterica]